MHVFFYSVDKENEIYWKNYFIKAIHPGKINNRCILVIVPLSYEENTKFWHNFTLGKTIKNEWEICMD